MIFFPVDQPEKKSYETETLSRKHFRLTKRKKNTAMLSRDYFRLTKRKNTSASPFPAASLMNVTI
jgi:hypothetical protein